MTTLVAVPNISEGHDTAKVARIAGTDALLDVHSDPDHNRSVLTYGGEQDDVLDACFAMIERAVAELDINAHDGAHPRFGVVDVLPFVSEQDLTDAVADFAWRIAQGPGVPTFIYGHARSLPQLRRALREDPPVPHPTAGVLCIGARDPLIAFNVNVRGTSTGAQKAATQLRKLPGVRALAFDLPSRGLVQLSMNLVDLEKTGPRRAFEVAEALAGVHDLEIVDAEVVGLVPKRFRRELEDLPLRTPARSVEDALDG